MKFVKDFFDSYINIANADSIKPFVDIFRGDLSATATSVAEVGKKLYYFRETPEELIKGAVPVSPNLVDYTKLLVVAKAAKLVSQGMHDENYFIMGSELLEKALEDLESK